MVPSLRRSHAWLEQHRPVVAAALLTLMHAALEMMALLLDTREGDEARHSPSYTLSLPPTPSCCAVVCQSLSIFRPDAQH